MSDTVCKSNNPLTDDGFDGDFRVIEATLIAAHAPLATLGRLARIRNRLADAEAARTPALPPSNGVVNYYAEDCGCVVSSTPCSILHDDERNCGLDPARHYALYARCSQHPTRT